MHKLLKLQNFDIILIQSCYSPSILPNIESAALISYDNINKFQTRLRFSHSVHAKMAKVQQDVCLTERTMKQPTLIFDNVFLKLFIFVFCPFRLLASLSLYRGCLV